MTYSFLRPLVIFVGLSLTFIGLGAALFVCYLLYLMFLSPDLLPFVDSLHAIAKTFTEVLKEVAMPDRPGELNPAIGFVPIAFIAVFLLASLGGIVRALTFAGVDLMKFAFKIKVDDGAHRIGPDESIGIDEL